MHLDLSEEQRLLSSTFSRLFEKESSTDTVRRAEPLGFDPALWRKLVDLGTAAIRVDEKHGGAGLGLRDICLVTYQAGYHIAPAPVAECAVAARLLSRADTETAQSWLSKVVAGKAIVALAAHPLTHSNPQVISYGAVADACIALADDQLLLFDASCRGEHVDNLGSQPLARWSMQADRGILLAEGEWARELYGAAIEEWKLQSASQLCGMSMRALEYAAEYSNEREAFGVKIGTFQGLSHPLADAFTLVDGARLLTDYTVWKLERGHDDAAAHIAMSYWLACEAACQTMPQCVHIFGGYGVSEEHDIQLFARRGIALTSVLGDRQQDLVSVALRLWGEAYSYTPEAGHSGLDFDLGEAAQQAAERLQDFFDANLGAEHDAYRGHSWDGYRESIYKGLADAGLLFPQWPEERGGFNASPAQMWAITQTFYRNRWTSYPQGTSKMVGDMIQKFGSDKLKSEVLPLIISGDAICSLGLTEPHCGSDVFAARTRAQKKGDKWLINGQKMFTSGANLARYVMLLAVVDPNAPKHEGKAFFIVPMDHPGVEVHKVDTISGDRTNITYYADVELEDDYRLGELDAGLKVISHMLTLEQTGSYAGLELSHLLAQAVPWAKTTQRGTDTVFDDRLAQVRLATAAVHCAVAEAMMLRLVAEQESGNWVRHHASMLKAFITEACKKDAADIINMAAPDSLITGSDELSYVEGTWRASLAGAIYAGTTQVHRSVIAESGLGMPRSR